MIKKQLTLLAISILMFSCNEEIYEEDKVSIENVSINDNYFPLDSAILYAENIELFDNSYSNKSLLNKKGERSIKKVKNLKRVKNSKKKDSFYIVNYDKGFVMISADKRVAPILAFSDTNNFDFEKEEHSEGLSYWLNYTSEGILNLTQKEANDSIKHIWGEFTKSNYNISAKIPIEEPDCTPYNIIKGPFIQTKWGQGYSYNDFTPNYNCPNYIGGYTPTGCVATALAQIMYKYQKPSTFNYNNMYLNFGTTETALLMKDIGDKVGMKYSCEGSSSSTENAYNALKNYGYANVKKENYNYQKVKNILDSGHPVIISGGNMTGGLFPKYENGHMWIIDGYMSYVDPCWGSTLHFRMNWGWSGANDGYYAFNNFYIPDTNSSFNDKNEIIYNF